VATYDLKPEMSAIEVKDKLVEALKTNKYDWIVANLANADMVGHTGVYPAIETAVKTIDQCLSEIVETARKMGYETIITADHGNADKMMEPDGAPFTAHTTNPVPVIVVGSKYKKLREGGVLADLAPTMLQLMELPQPKEMTGKSLIAE
jgi:2,3-bisphosphoglycerate-independent phosphoglycerate mutase